MRSNFDEQFHRDYEMIVPLKTAQRVKERRGILMFSLTLNVVFNRFQKQHKDKTECLFLLLKATIGYLLVRLSFS